MKKLLPLGLAAVLSLLGSGTARAGSIDYLTNQSADYIRVLARNHATDGADAVNFNPAGTAFLPDNGLYLNFSWQLILKDYKIKYEGEEFGSTKPTPFLPAFYAVYKWNDLAAFAAFTVPAGGGSLKYDKGVPFLKPLAARVTDKTSSDPTDGFFEGSSMYLAGSFGASYKFFDKVSVSAVGRVVSGKKTFTGNATYGENLASLDATKTAAGIGGIFGIHFRPLKQLDIGLRYETETALNWETSSTTTNINDPNSGCFESDGKTLIKGELPQGVVCSPLDSFADGKKEQRNLPALFGAGIAWHVPWIPNLTLAGAFIMYFIKAADDHKDAEGVLGFSKGYNDNYDNGFEFSIGAEYLLFERYLLSLGYNRTIPGSNAKTLTDFEYTLAANTVGGGARIKVLPRLNVTVAAAMAAYETEDNEALNAAFFKKPETFEKLAFLITLGAEYRLF